MACEERCIADENGEPYEYGPDTLGNECLIIPRGTFRKTVTFNSGLDEVPDPACCALDEHTGGVAVDVADADNPCVAQICAGPDLGWLPICGGSTTPTEPTPQKVCYDLTTWTFPLTYGNTNDSWLINGTNRLDSIDCQAVPLPSYPGTVESTCQFSAASATYNHPQWETLTWDDTGQGAGEGTTISATGNPDDGWACTRPSFRINFGIPTGQGQGPYEFDTEITDGSGGIGFGMYDECNQQYLPITGFTTTPTGTAGTVQSAYLNQTSLGDQLFINSVDTSGNPWTGKVRINYANPNNTDASCISMIVTAMGNYSGNDNDDLEQIVGTILTYTPTSAGSGQCCRTANNPADIAMLLNETTPLGDVWTVTGNQVCATVPLGGEAAYGALSLPCDGHSANPDVSDA